jgi:hypothetical protein
MRDGNATKSLGSAILSLLVTADQRCPAIIGQAHLLYHGRLRTDPEETAQTFAQLKRDADDLYKAIAAVEAAINANDRDIAAAGLSSTTQQFAASPRRG